MDRPIPPAFAAFQPYYLRDEEEALRGLLAEPRLPADAAERVQARARALVENVRSKQVAHRGMQSLAPRERGDLGDDAHRQAREPRPGEGAQRLGLAREARGARRGARRAHG